MKNTAALLKALKIRILFSLLVENVLKFAVPAFCFITAVSLIDYLLSFSLPLREILTSVVILWAGYCLYRFLRAALSGVFSDGNILMGLGRDHPEFKDEIISAWQLSKNPPAGVSAELTRLLIEKTENAAPSINVSRDIKLVTRLSLRLIYVLTALAAFCLLLYIVRPGVVKSSFERFTGALTNSDWKKWFDVKPGSTELPWGEAVDIAVNGKNDLPGRPALMVRSEDGSWVEEELTAKPGKVYGYTIEKLAGKIDYKIKWAQFKTDVFELVPVTAPQLGDFTLKYVYPAYTGMGAQTVKGNPAVSAISGTKVTLSARSTKKLKTAKILTSWKSDAVAGADGYNVSASFSVTKDGAYKLIVVAEDGSTEPEPDEYQVKVTADQPPLVELLSPSDDLVVAENTEIPLVVHVEDDFGITRVALAYRNGSGSEEKVNISDIEKGVNRKDIEYVWKLSRLNPAPGDRITYYVEAWDNDLVGGPKSSTSKTLSIEINDYSKEHDKIEAGLKDVRDDILTLLADQTASRKKVKELETAFSTSTYADALTAQAKIKEDAAKPLEKLRGALDKMENDPLCDFATYSEYRGMNSELEYLRNNQMPKAVDSLKTSDIKEASKNEDEIIASLEKMALLSEDVWQYQRMKDLFNTGEDLKKAAADLKDQLGSGPQADKFKSQLKKIEDMLDKINNQVSKLPQELPEDFVNSQAVKNINMASFQDTLSKMKEAAAKGDWKQAQELMDEFQKSLESLMDGLESAGGNIGFSKDKDDELAGKINDYSARLDGIIESQKSWLEKANQADSERRHAAFLRQEKTLQSLLDKQKALIELASAVRKDFVGDYHMFGTYVIDQSINLMGKVLEEFKNKRAFNSQKYLSDIITNWNETEKTAVNPLIEITSEKRAKTVDNVQVVIKGEQDILETLKKGDTPPAGDEPGAGKYENISNEETGLGAKTFSLHKEMQDFTRKSTAIEPEAFENLSEAGSGMNDVAAKISSENTGGAVDAGQKALELLEQGRNGLKSAQGRLSDMKGNSGSKVSGTVQTKSGGSYGFKTARVKLPGKDDYKPPKEFRQEIMEALKEKYPQKYEKLIREYYRRLTE